MTSNSIACMLVATVVVIMSLGSIFFAFMFYGDTQDGVFAFLEAGIIFALVTTFVGIFIAILYGIPVYSLLGKLNVRGYFSLVVAGSLPGIVFYLLVPNLFYGSIIIIGAVIAILFHWLKLNKYFA